MYDDNRSIVAPITDIKSKNSAIAVIRISGKNAIKLCNEIFISKNLENQASHTLHFGKLVFKKHIIDEVLVSIFKSPNSYTGENVVEISCHASPFITKKIIDVLISLGGRAAVAGEFTQRAFFNGKLDLLQAESIAALIGANNKYEHEAALKVLTGHLSKKIKELKGSLVRVKSLIELEIDFMEDHNLNVNNINNLQLLVKSVRSQIINLIDGFNSRSNEKPQIVIIGEPNVGKSSLFNTLINEDRAIISDIPGTTRDIISETIIHDGLEITINDTAGLRETQDTIESIGIDKAYQKTKNADIILYVFDIENTNIQELAIKTDTFDKSKLIFIASKADTFEEARYSIFKEQFPKLIFVSSLQNLGIQELKYQIHNLVDKRFSKSTAILINARHYNILSASLNNLDNAINMLSKSNFAYEIIAFEINEAIMQLKSITGEITNDDYLSEIFSSFCIGK